MVAGGVRTGAPAVVGRARQSANRTMIDSLELSHSTARPAGSTPLNTEPAAGCPVSELAAFARAVSEAADLASARTTLLGLAAELLGVPAAALTHITEPGSLTFVATGGAAADRIAEIALQVRQGVCWQVHQTATPVLCDDLTGELRWPAFRAAALDRAPIRSIAGLPLRFADQLFGALLLYSERPGHFTPEQMSQAELVADHAGMALAHATARARVANLEIALRTNREIAIAIGIIMDRDHLNEAQAFDLLQKLSQVRQVKLRDIAADIALSGEIPEVPTRLAKAGRTQMQDTAKGEAADRAAGQTSHIQLVVRPTTDQPRSRRRSREGRRTDRAGG